MKKKHYYSALKTLEQLEHTFLPPVKGYIFSDLLFKEIPKIRKSIEDQSNTDLTVSFFATPNRFHFTILPLQDFLAKIRERSAIIGEVAMHQVIQLTNIIFIQDYIFGFYFQALKHAYLEIDFDVKTVLEQKQKWDPEACAQDLVDFSPVYRCLHIHSVLVRLGSKVIQWI